MAANNYSSDSSCADCDNKACRYGGCQGRKPDRRHPAEIAYCAGLSQQMLEHELNPSKFWSLPK